MRQELPEEFSIQAGYAAWASCYDDDGNPLIALEEPAVSAWFGPLRGSRVLDLGCGTGRHTWALADAGAKVWALDLTLEMIARARSKRDGRNVCWVRHALPQALPFPVSTFDAVVLGLVIEHIADLPRLLAESARVLKPGGRCIVSALHPERTGEGQRARFIDPETGHRRAITTFHRTIEQYLQAGTDAGLILEGEQTLVVPPELAERLPRAVPYVGRPLGWVACWSQPNT
ncbi:class I SAM-dependent methyltransferase [Singulisphaera sp. Ch08]|uniref:Class I SAM-dependent methyltransferase n=1 Tax=Singulisphaera sp. Ch08 TaxID=3120278 RepID=A0AAU7CHY5_9BACT